MCDSIAEGGRRCTGQHLTLDAHRNRAERRREHSMIAQHTWHGLGIATKSTILTATAAVLLGVGAGAGYLAGTAATPTPWLLVILPDSDEIQPLDITMCAQVKKAVRELPPPQMYVDAVEARCP